MLMFSLANKVAIVTGGLGILGRYFCRALSEHGATVVIVDKTCDYGFAESIGGYCVPIDITDEDKIAKLVEFIYDRYGRIDILHNNAATKPADLIRFFDPVADTDMGIWREVMSVNLDAMFMMAKHVGGFMAKQGWGSIIQTASIYGILAPDQRIYDGSEYLGHSINTPPVYSASKAGVVGLTKYLSSYWGASGVRVNTLTPGGVESGQNETFKQKYSARIPLGRMAKPEEMTGALVFLASDASSYITGQNIIVDGGLSVW